MRFSLTCILVEELRQKVILDTKAGSFGVYALS